MSAPKNMNELALAVTKEDQSKKEVSVAQVKQTLKALAGVLKKHPSVVMQLLLRYSAKQ